MLKPGLLKTLLTADGIESLELNGVGVVEGEEVIGVSEETAFVEAEEVIGELGGATFVEGVDGGVVLGGARFVEAEEVIGELGGARFVEGVDGGVVFVGAGVLLPPVDGGGVVLVGGGVLLSPVDVGGVLPVDGLRISVPTGTLMYSFVKGELSLILKDLTVGEPGMSDLKSNTVGLSPPLRSLYRGPTPVTLKVPLYWIPVSGSVTMPV